MCVAKPDSEDKSSRAGSNFLIGVKGYENSFNTCNPFIKRDLGLKRWQPAAYLCAEAADNL